jgi:hypothetical protein
MLYFSCVTPLKKEGKLITETEEKANILNQQFQSVLTNETDLNIPDKGPSPHPHVFVNYVLPMESSVYK